MQLDTAALARLPVLITQIKLLPKNQDFWIRTTVSTEACQLLCKRDISMIGFRGLRYGNCGRILTDKLNASELVFSHGKY